MSKIYLISPPKIDLTQFSQSLKVALNTGLVPVFQLRLKEYENAEIIKIARELKNICHDFNSMFILNDSYKLALEVGADGVHLGDEDGIILAAKKSAPQNFIIGASCYDSRHLAVEASEQGADYVSFGAFFASQTKNSKGKPTTEILEWSREILDLPIVAIGGITDKNCAPLIKSGADFLAIISYVWQHPQGISVALQNIDRVIKSTVD